MNKFSLLFALALALLITPAAFGQSRFSLAPTIGYGFYQDRQPYNLPDAHGQVTEVQHTGKQTVTWAGLTAHYQFSSRWSVSVGLVSNRSVGKVQTYITQYFPAFPSLGGIGTGFISESTTQTWQLPISINYVTSTHRLSPYLSMGIIFNYVNRIRNLNSSKFARMIGKSYPTSSTCNYTGCSLII